MARDKSSKKQGKPLERDSSKEIHELVTRRVNKRLADQPEADTPAQGKRASTPTWYIPLGALVIVLISAAAVLLWRSFLLHSQHPNEEANIDQAVHQWVTSINSSDYETYSHRTCASITNNKTFTNPAQFRLDTEALSQKYGKINVTKVTDIVATGAHGSATIVWQDSKNSHQPPADHTVKVPLVHDISAGWTVCSAHIVQFFQ